MATDLSMRMAAAGIRGSVLDESDGAAMRVLVKSDAMWVAMKSDKTAELSGTDGDVSRLWLTLEGQRTFETGGGGARTPNAEIGRRHDGGDAETGAGVEVGAELLHTRGHLSIQRAHLHAHHPRRLGLRGVGRERDGARGTRQLGARAHALGACRVRRERKPDRAPVGCAGRAGTPRQRRARAKMVPSRHRHGLRPRCRPSFRSYPAPLRLPSTAPSPSVSRQPPSYTA